MLDARPGARAARGPSRRRAAAPPEPARAVAPAAERGVRRRCVAALAEPLDPESMHGVLDACADWPRLERHGGRRGDVRRRRGRRRLRPRPRPARTTRCGPCGPRSSCGTASRRSAPSWSVKGSPSTRARRSSAPAPRREPFATGDAINVAERLQEAAGPGEILLGELTCRLAEGLVAEPLEPLAVARTCRPGGCSACEPRRGRPAADLGDAVRRAGGGARPAPLRAGAARPASAGCHLVTLLGTPGIGKSRLVRELIAATAAAATAVVGRCPPYGEGSSFSPLAEIVRQLAGSDPEPRLVGDHGRRRAGRGDRPQDARRDRAARRAGQGGGDGMGGAPAVRAGRARPSAHRGPRRRPLGRPDPARPARARGRVLERRADPARLHRPPGAAGEPPVVGGAAAAAVTARARGAPGRAGAAPRRRRRARVAARGPDRRHGRGQPAVPRAARGGPGRAGARRRCRRRCRPCSRRASTASSPASARCCATRRSRGAASTRRPRRAAPGRSAQRRRTCWRWCASSSSAPTAPSSPARTRSASPTA